MKKAQIHIFKIPIYLVHKVLKFESIQINLYLSIGKWAKLIKTNQNSHKTRIKIIENKLENIFIIQKVFLSLRHELIQKLYQYEKS